MPSLTARATDASVFVAVGLLSAAGSTAKSNSSTGVWRRTSLRSYVTAYRALTAAAAGSSGPGAALRFVLAGGGPLSDDIRQEANTHGDMIFLNMTEGIYRCTRKYLEWLRIAPSLFPSARFFALGDDDIFLSLAHLESDLRAVASYTRPDERVLWGLIMWKAR